MSNEPSTTLGAILWTCALCGQAKPRLFPSRYSYWDLLCKPCSDAEWCETHTTTTVVVVADHLKTSGETGGGAT